MLTPVYPTVSSILLNFDTFVINFDTTAICLKTDKDVFMLSFDSWPHCHVNANDYTFVSLFLVPRWVYGSALLK